MSFTSNQAAPLAAIAHQALAHWGWPPDSAVALLKLRENAVFRVVAPDGRRAVLRLHRPNYHSRAALHSELQWMAALHAHGIPTPQVVPTLNGALLVEVAGLQPGAPVPIDMLDWIDGVPVGSAEARDYAGAQAIATLYTQLGRLAARMHAHSMQWQRPAGFWRQSWDLAGCIGAPGSPADPAPLWGHYHALSSLSAAQRALFDHAADRVRRRLVAFGTGPDRYGLVHGDLVPDNLMVTADDSLAVLDFDDCGSGWYLWEMATALFWHIGEDSYEPARQAYVAGYRALLPLAPDHLAMLPTMLMMRALVYLGWMQSRAGTDTAIELTPHVVALSERLANELLSAD